MTAPSWLGIPLAKCSRLAESLGTAPHPAIDVVAAVASSVVAEPGDAVWGECVAHADAATVVAALVESANASEFAVALGLPIDAVLVAGWQRWHAKLSSHAVLDACERAVRIGARVLLPGDADWPPGFFDLGPYMPHVLYIRGRALAAWGRSIALVGARAASGYGEHVAAEAASGLAARGAMVVSGGAYGIDGVSHRASLATSGTTIAFLAGGIDRLYPSGHTDLLTEIIHAGAVIAEHPCGASPTRFRFLQRNRLIAAASNATVVIEAGRRSGSLNTAHHAASIGRPLGAVPGPVTSPSSAGCHYLLREGAAQCVTDADEMAELAWGVADRGACNDDPSTQLGSALFNALARIPRSVAELSAQLQLSEPVVAGMLAEAEFDGWAERRDGLWVKSVQT